MPEYGAQYQDDSVAASYHLRQPYTQELFTTLVEITIREYQPADASGLRRCVVQLQEYERTLEPRLRAGEIIADAYCEMIHVRCRRSRGCVFMADEAGTVVGFAAALAHVPFTELDDPPGTYALVTDLVVLPNYRGRGIGRRLLEHAESFVRAEGASELRIGVLASNEARRLYVARGFTPYLEILAKRL
ncbi:MAG: GNAT family N-acetyltransferase [Longimicrobiales bacterium]